MKKWSHDLLFGAILCVLVLFTVNSDVWADNFTWTLRTTPTGAIWQALAASSDCQKIAIGGENTYIYTSTDGGASWTQRTGSGSRIWQCIGSSADGNMLAAGAYNGYIYTSIDGGATWEERTGSGSRYWYGIASSSDGSKLVATGGSDIIVSVDSGATWNTITSAGSRSWCGIAISPDGMKIAAVASNNYVYTSSDGGTTWTTRSNIGSQNWVPLAASSDIKTIVVGAWGGYVKSTSDSGNTWTQHDGVGSAYWHGAGCSSNGNVMAVTQTSPSGYVWTTTNGGTTWASEASAGSRTWWGVVSSSDGTKLVATYTGYVYTGTTSPASAPTVTTSSITSITSTTASGGGNVTADGGATVTARGVCWSTSANPTTSDNHTTDGSGTGSFTSSLTSLTPGTLYHVRAYATNSVGTSYGGDSTFTTLATPTVTTATITSITSTTASSGGNVTSDGGATVTARGVCWSTSVDPTTADSKTTDGSGTGVFTSSLTSLTPGTLYHVRAYATNSVGTSYGDDSTFTTLTTPTVTTATITSITSTTASGGGNVTADGGDSVTARGVCWSTAANPTTADSKTTDGSGTGTFTSSLTSLTPGTLYHVRAYATNSVGTSYGGDSTFTTLTTPTVTTTTITSITSTTASGGGNVTADGGDSVTARGVCWSTSANPTTSDSHTTDGSGTGPFTSSLTSLTPGTLYHVRAYATNSVGTSYGGDSTFTTLATPTVTTATITSITSTTASSGGNVTSDGGDSVTARGVCWSTSVDPTTADSKTTDGSGTGVFTSSLTSLTPGTLYHVRAYATNSVGTTYGGDSTFTTLTAIPTVTTASVTSITSTTAASGGNVTSSGGATVTARGVCWSTSANPTIADSHTVDSSGTGTFTSSITGLDPDTTYYVRAYATNSVGTGYGNQVSFTTLRLYTISGYTRTSDSTAIEGVLMDGLPGDLQTDSAGFYTTTVDSGWSGTVKPVHENYAFDPESTIYSDVAGDQETDYMGTFRKVIISGYVRSGGEGVEGVVMNGLPEDPRTDSRGYYAGIVDTGWCGIVIPSYEDCLFLPEDIVYIGVNCDQINQDYTATCLSLDVDDEDNLVPREYQLAQNHPNPFNPETEIVFGLPKTGFVTLKIYNILGQDVTTLVDKYLSAGEYRVIWNGTDKSGRAVSSGVYFYRMQAGNFAQTKQMLLLK